MRYCVLYLQTENVNLIKDMGMIPYKLNELYGFDSYVACYKNGEYPYLKKEVKGLKLFFVKNRFHSKSLDGVRFLKSHAKDIDVLQIFSVTLSSVFYAYAYKHYNPNGKLYLKLDCTNALVKKINGLGFLGRKIFDAFLDKTDLISAEQESLYLKLKDILGRNSSKLIKVADGVDYEYLDKMNLTYDFSKKENIILNVARIGTEQKNTQMLLEAFKNIKNIENLDWKLILVGTIEDDFHSYIDNFYNENPKIKDKVIFTGSINDREKLFNMYKRAKIFCLSSRPRFESFGIVYVEAAALGDVIISTDVGIAKELVQWNNGAIVKVEDTPALTKELDKFIKIQNLKSFSDITYEKCREKFDWGNIVIDLKKELDKL